MDGLKNKMQTIAFVNESLKDNHQVEIVEAMIERDFISGFLTMRDFSVQKVY